jgi:hypothetical protein
MHYGTNWMGWRTLIASPSAPKTKPESNVDWVQSCVCRWPAARGLIGSAPPALTNVAALHA